MVGVHGLCLCAQFRWAVVSKRFAEQGGRLPAQLGDELAAAAARRCPYERSDQRMDSLHRVAPADDPGDDHSGVASTEVEHESLAGVDET